jgi:hypothetical protein
VPAFGDGSQTDSHFLNHECNRAENDQEANEALTAFSSGCGVGCNTTGIVVRHHNDDARSGNEEK